MAPPCYPNKLQTRMKSLKYIFVKIVMNVLYLMKSSVQLIKKISKGVSGHLSNVVSRREKIRGLTKNANYSESYKKVT